MISFLFFRIYLLTNYSRGNDWLLSDFPIAITVSLLWPDKSSIFSPNLSINSSKLFRSISPYYLSLTTSQSLSKGNTILEILRIIVEMACSSRSPLYFRNINRCSRYFRQRSVLYVSTGIIVIDSYLLYSDIKCIVCLAS